MKQHQPVRQQRKLKNQSQKQVYTAIGMAQQTYSNKERGLHKFTRDELELIARHLGVDVSVFDEQPPATLATPEPKAELNVIEALAVVQNGHISLRNEHSEILQRLTKLEREREEEKKKKARKPVKRKKKKR